MAIADYFKGHKHKAEATRLQADLETQRLQFQSELQALHIKYMALETKAKETGALDLIDVQARIQNKQARLLE